jgi:hypothetical protein
VVVLDHGTLALEHMDGHAELIVIGRGEQLRLLGGYGCVARNDIRGT